MFKDKLHRALAHIAAGADKMAQAAQEVLTPLAGPSKETRMGNHDRAANIIAHGLKNGDSPARIARHLADYGLITPDPPEPRIFLDTGEREWAMKDGYVSVEDGIIHVIHDETDDDREPAELRPDHGELRFSNTTKGRETAYALLAACDHKDAQDEQTK